MGCKWSTINTIYIFIVYISKECRIVDLNYILMNNYNNFMPNDLTAVKHCTCSHDITDLRKHRSIVSSKLQILSGRLLTFILHSVINQSNFYGKKVHRYRNSYFLWRNVELLSFAYILKRAFTDFYLLLIIIPHKVSIVKDVHSRCCKVYKDIDLLIIRSHDVHCSGNAYCC